MVGGFAALLCMPIIVSCSSKLASAGEATLFVTGDTRGYLEPCGCRRDQAGGLPGRMTLVEQNAKGDKLLVDVGNLTNGSRSYDLLKLDFLLDGMKRLNYAAINLGRQEAELDRDTLQKIIKDSGAPFVSCNVLERTSQRPITEPYRIVNIAGVRVGITGVVESPEDEVGPGLTVRPAAEALAEVLPQLRAKCDWVVVLAFVPEETQRAIADRFHEVSCILGGDVQQSSSSVTTINRASVFNVTDKGKVLGILTLKREGDALSVKSGRAERVADTIKPAAEMTQIIGKFKDTLRDRNLEFAAEEGMEPIGGASTADLYVGQQACASCHANSHKVSEAAAHMRAYQTLVEKKSEFDPDCLRCHTVGYGVRDGFINLQRTPKLAGIQCESCHGRGADHIKLAQAGKPSRTLRVVTPNSCIRCHDQENSENFKYETYWPKIRHGKD
jgi:2',3'-cyclic-nucleotide 2'-phosphodiesterase (5'-nucleotidase family)